MICADLHIHTNHSSDSTIRPKTLVEQLTVQNLINVAAVTDHNTVNGCSVTQKLASAYPDILVIPGVEITTQEGDIVLLGTAEIPPEPHTVETVIEFARENNCVSVVAHPYREFGMGDLAKHYNFDAVEVANGTSSSYANKLARDLAKSMDLPSVAGSDAHRPSELWTAYTEVHASLNIDEILKAIKKGLTASHSCNRSIGF